MKTPQECCEKWMELRGLAMYSPQMEEAMRLFLEWYENDRPVAYEPSDAEVEELARVLADAAAEGFGESHGTYLRRLARAAYAHIGAEVARLRHKYEVERDRANDLMNDSRCAFMEMPVKVRFDVSQQEILSKWNGAAARLAGMCDPVMEPWLPNLMAEFCDFLASRAVIDLPADVPSAEELAKVIEYQIAIDGGADAASIVRILAPWLQPRTVTAEQVEAFAREMYRVRWAMDWVTLTEPTRDPFRAHLRAGLAAAGFTVEEEK